MSSYKSWLEKQKKKINKTYDAQKKTVEDEYKNAVNDTSSAYESEYRQNEVDRIFNEKKIAEINANLGLTNSGLNRTQQTAVQLSHSNRDYEISKARQDNIDDLALQKSKAITEINLNRQNAIAEAEDQAQTMKTTAARTYSGGSPKTVDNNESTTYWSFDGIDEETGKYVFSDGNGKTKTIAKGVNPYTGLPVANPGGFDVWNGYQPKGVYYDGTNLGKITNQGMGKINYQGHTKQVWRSYNAIRIDGLRVNYWVWDDYKGSYVPVIKDGDGDYCVYQE